MKGAKSVLLAATGAVAIAGAAFAAEAQRAPVAAPLIVSVAPSAPATDDANADKSAASPAGPWAIGGLIAGALALIAAIRSRTLRAFAAPAVNRAAATAAAAVRAATDATVRVLKKPLRAAVIAVAAAALGIVSIDQLDWEWAAGLAVGAIATVVAFIGFNRLQRFANAMVGKN